MKKTIALLFTAALIIVLSILIFRPDLLDRFREKSPGPDKAPVSGKRSGPSAPPPATRKARPEPVEDAPPQPARTVVLLQHLQGRSVYVNGADLTGEEQCQVTPGRTIVVTWDKDRFSHEVLDVETGEEVSPEGVLQSAPSSPSWSGFQGGPSRTGWADASARNGITMRWTGDVGDKVQSTPMVNGGRAYFASGSSLVRAVDLSTGSLLWSIDNLGGKANPVAMGDFVFAGNEVGRFEGFRAAKGKLRGTTRLGSGLASLARASEDLLLAATSTGALLAITTRSNMVGRLPLKQSWAVSVPGLSGSTATPLILGDRAILQTADGQLMAVSIDDGRMIWPTGKNTTEAADAIPDPDGEQVIRFITHQSFLTPTPAADQGVIHAVHRDRIRAVHVEDGTVLWERTFNGDAASSVSLAWDTIYFGCTDGTVRAFSRHGGVPIFEARLGENPIFASPVLFAGQLLAANGEGKLMLLDAFSGAILAEDQTLAGSPIDATPAVWKDGILAINRKGQMACFE